LTGRPFDNGPRLRLVGSTIERWRAVSGWSLADPRGPKPVRRIVPAGGVYFFDVEDEENAAGLVDHWLQSVSDGEQDRRDGFGLAVWGTWHRDAGSPH
jgi:CRISPR-associated protein Cmr3